MKKHYLCSTFFTLLLTANMFYGYTQDGGIKGIVHGKESALEVATVSVGNKSVLTGKDGEFSMSLKPGNYILTISHSGYENEKREIKIAAGNIESLNLTLIPLGQLGEVVVLGSRSFKERT